MPRRTPQSLEEAMRDLRQAELAVQAIKEAAKLTEPANRAIVQFRASFPGGRKQFSFVAIRADNWRTDGRRWFISGNTDVEDLERVQSPMTWLTLITWAEILLVPTGWRRVDNPVAGSDVPVMLDPISAPRAPHLLDQFEGMPTDLSDIY